MLKSVVKLSLGLILAFYIIKTFIFTSLDYFWLGLLLQLVQFKKLKNFIEVNCRFTMLRSRTLVKGEVEEVGKELIKSIRDQGEAIDFMSLSSREI